ncbi:MAG: cellulase family glycosylhydrolase [Armatimonadota bacterium]|nr:cellulase family glycosylhydrolase [Armatimonadota bacterium]
MYFTTAIASCFPCRKSGSDESCAHDKEGVRRMGKAQLLLYAALLVFMGAPVVGVTLGISADGRFFTIDGVPKYLNGISYYSGTSISTPSWVTQDLDDMVARDMNWIRVWTFWGGCSNGAVTDLSGNVREPYMSRLKTIITEANSRGMIVDVTMSRDSGASTMSQYIACAQTIATHLLPYRNVYIDVGNERHVGDSRYISYTDVASIISAIKAIDPNRICTASGTPTSQGDLNNYITSGCQFISPHLCRESGCAAQTFGTVRTCVTWMTNLGTRIPVHLQEPFRRSYGSYDPVQEDYYRDNSGGKAAEAAGWCLHNGSGGGLQRSFCMSDTYGRLFAQLDSVEQDVANNISDAIGGTSWTIRRYQAEYSEQVAHAIGRKEGLFWSANVTQDVAGFLTYGPYLNGIPAGIYRAAWRLMIDNNTANNDPVATLDVYSGGVIIAQRIIRRQEFAAANAWQAFNVDYTSVGQQNLEFRTYWNDNSYLKVDHITLSPDPPPDSVSGFTSIPAEGQITLTWTNPMTPGFTGTVVRYKTAGYPSSESDGTFLCDRPGAPSSSDSYVHAGLTEPAYFYAAFAHDASGRYSPGAFTSASPRAPADWISESFDSYADGDLGGKGDWATSGAGSAQVESSFAKGGAGKAVIMDCIASGASIANQILCSEKTSGYYYLTLDVAQNAAGTTGAAFASVSVFGSSSPAEIAKLHIQKGRLMVEYGSGSYAVLTTTAANNIWYAVKIGFNIDTRKIDLWLDGNPKGTNYSWKGSGTNISKIVIASDRNTNLTTQQAFLDNIIFDFKPGQVATVFDGGGWTPSLSKLRFYFDPVAGAGEYHYSIGTTPGGTQTRDWTSCGLSTDHTASGIALTENQMYYVSVQAGTGHGIWGATRTSDGIKVAPGMATILAAKALPNGTSSDVKALRGKLVSAAFSGSFYIQEPASPIGLKVVSSASVASGDEVDVAGVMGGAASERFIDCTGNGVIKTTPGPGGPDTVVLSAASVGGTELNSYSPGVVGGIGPNNIGLFATVFGIVTQRQTTAPMYFYVDDGSGRRDGTTTGGSENVGVRVISDPAGFAEGSYVAVKGAVSCFDSSGPRPQILPSRIDVLQGP